MLAIWYVATSDSRRACCKGGMANEKKKDQLSFSMQSCDESWHGSNDLAGGPEVTLEVHEAAAVHVGLGAEVLGLGRDGHALHLVHPQRQEHRHQANLPPPPPPPPIET